MKMSKYKKCNREGAVSCKNGYCCRCKNGYCCRCKVMVNDDIERLKVKEEFNSLCG